MFKIDFFLAEHALDNVIANQKAKGKKEAIPTNC